MNLKLDELPPSVADFSYWRSHSQSLNGLALVRSYLVNAVDNDEPERIGSAKVSAGFFPLLGIKPLLGRWFTEDDDRPGSHVVIISYSLWRRRFGGDPHIVGTKIVLDGFNYEVVGIMPKGFQFPTSADIKGGYGFSPHTEVWKPLSLSVADYRDHNYRSCVVIGRLRQGVRLEQAQAEIAIEARQLAALNPVSNAGWATRVVRLQDQLVGDSRTALWILLGAVGLLLLIGCSSVAMISVAKIASRRREIAVRAAVGATRADLVRQFLIESLLLSFLSGIVGILLAYAAVHVLVNISPVDVARITETRIDSRVLAFAVCITVIAGLLSGILPALRMSSGDLAAGLKNAVPNDLLRLRHYQFRRLLTAMEVALAMVLLVSAGLLIQSFRRLLHSDPGFDSANVLSMDILLPIYRYPGPSFTQRFFREAVYRLERLPNVDAAGAVSNLPLTGSENFTGFEIEGKSTDYERMPAAEYRACSPGYFRAMGTPLIEGRSFSEQDDQEHPPVAIINQALVHRVFGGKDPIGRRIRFRGPSSVGQWLVVVGVVADIKHSSLEQPALPQIYRSYLQDSWLKLDLVVRTKAKFAIVVPQIRELFRRMDSQLPVADLHPLKVLVAESLARRRFSAILLTSLSFIALLLSVAGVYGIVAQSVQERRHEIGIRMALGAEAPIVARMVVLDAVLTVALGILAGTGASMGLTRSMRSLLYGVSQLDPATYIAVPVVLVIGALIASVLPAIRAARVDPMISLRTE